MPNTKPTLHDGVHEIHKDTYLVSDQDQHQTAARFMTEACAALPAGARMLVFCDHASSMVRHRDELQAQGIEAQILDRAHPDADIDPQTRVVLVLAGNGLSVAIAGFHTVAYLKGAGFDRFQRAVAGKIDAARKPR